MKANNSHPRLDRLHDLQRAEELDLDDFDFDFDEDFEAEFEDEWPSDAEADIPVTEEALQALASRHMVMNNRLKAAQARRNGG